MGSEAVLVTTSRAQSALYKGMYDHIPLPLRNKMKQVYTLTPAELERLTGFPTGPGQAGRSTRPVMRSRPVRSPGRQAALASLKAEPDATPAAKGRVFSNRIDAGLTPY